MAQVGPVLEYGRRRSDVLICRPVYRTGRVEDLGVRFK